MKGHLCERVQQPTVGGVATGKTATGEAAAGSAGEPVLAGGGPLGLLLSQLLLQLVP